MTSESLRYPFHSTGICYLWSKFRWAINERIQAHLGILNFFGVKFTVIDGFGAPGDTLLTAIVAHNIKRKFPRLKIHAITNNTELLKYDPNIESLNNKESFFSITHWYLDLLNDKDGTTNVVAHTLKKLGIKDFQYKAQYFIHENESEWAKDKVPCNNKPLIAINCLSKESVKNWPFEYWNILIDKLSSFVDFIQLGDTREPVFKNPSVLRFAGQTTMREAAAILGKADLFIGPDSFLAHVANGLSVQSIIIFGGSRTADNLGYSDNINLVNYPSCSPCWIHPSNGGICNYDYKCLYAIKPSLVLEEVRKILKITL